MWASASKLRRTLPWRVCPDGGNNSGAIGSYQRRCIMARALTGSILVSLSLLPMACMRPGGAPTEATVSEVAEAPPPARTPPSKPVAAAEVQKLVQGNTAFAFELYAALKDRGQLFISPYSVSTALAMLY